MRKKRLFKLTLTAAVTGFVLANTVAAFHAYRFTHFSTSTNEKTASPERLSVGDKIATLVFGVSNPKPLNKHKPEREYSNIKLGDSKELDCWYIPTNENAKGTVILFHGYSGEKSSMLDKADEFLRLGFNTLLVDFQGSGSSKGSVTTVGYREADDVKLAYDYLSKENAENIILFGTSMGAVAILKAIDEYQIAPDKLILECPFGSMYETVSARFNTMGLPSFPMAGLLVFWGGAENGFWGFGHDPIEYAQSVKIPTLLMYGEKDNKVSKEETIQIFKNLKGEKRLVTFSEAGHENYLTKYRGEWLMAVSQFIK